MRWLLGSRCREVWPCRPQPLPNTRPHGQDQSSGHEMTRSQHFLLLVFILFCQLVQLKPWRSAPQQRMLVEFMSFHLLVIVGDLERRKKKKVLKMATFKDVCSFGYLFFNWDLLQRLLEDANRAEQSGNLPLSDRTAAGLRLNLHSQPAKQSKRRVCLRSLSLPVRMFEPGGGAASLLRKRRHF